MYVYNSYFCSLSLIVWELFPDTRYSTLLDFAVILQLLTVKKYSKIPYIWFTVNYCNTHCIMGISV